MRFQLVCVLLLFTSLPTAQGGDDSTGQAKKTAERFVQALKAEDLEAAVKLSGVPFLMQHKTLTTREDFRRAFTELFEDKELGEGR